MARRKIPTHVVDVTRVQIAIDDTEREIVDGHPDALKLKAPNPRTVGILDKGRVLRGSLNLEVVVDVVEARHIRLEGIIEKTILRSHFKSPDGFAIRVAIRNPGAVQRVEVVVDIPGLIAFRDRSVDHVFVDRHVIDLQVARDARVALRLFFSTCRLKTGRGGDVCG